MCTSSGVMSVSTAKAETTGVSSDFSICTETYLLLETVEMPFLLAAHQLLYHACSFRVRWIAIKQGSFDDSKLC